jgi:uncharacterized protein
MNQKSLEQARAYALERLGCELSPRLHYHKLEHTRDEIVPATERLAAMEGISGSELALLLTAAWFHDLGYVEATAGHEALGARIAGEILPELGYTQDEIDVIQSAILATALPQSPQNLLEQILADADLDVLGRENFMERNSDLRREMSAIGREYTDAEWCQSQIRFMEGHSYFTASARELRGEQKQANIQRVRASLERMQSK